MQKSNNKGHYFWVSIFLFLFTYCFTSCKEAKVEFQSNDCKRQPAFIKSIGFNPGRSAFSTSEKRKMGLVLFEFDKPGDTTNGAKKIYQHPSWRMGGALGPIQIDPGGNCFVGPVPVINVLDNPPAKQNTIYKVDAISGEMKVFTSLPIAENISSTNPYGVMGFAYLCESNTLYVSSIQGSTRENEKGCIYAIDANTGKIIDQVNNIDVIGMSISFITEKRCLYFGSARTSEIFSIQLNKQGGFSGKQQMEFSLANLGPRGDDKARRIKFDKTGSQMQIMGIEFNYNLTAPTEKQETLYTFVWNKEEKKWQNSN